MILTSNKKNDFGVYYHNKYVNDRKVSFYYVSRNNDDSPERPTDRDVWLKYLNENRIVRSTRKRAYEPSQQIRTVTPVPPDDVDTISPSPAELHEKACQLSGSFWKDKKIEKLFNSSDMVSSLNDWIDQLKIAEFDMFALKRLINKSVCNLG